MISPSFMQWCNSVAIQKTLFENMDMEAYLSPKIGATYTKEYHVYWLDIGFHRDI
jgi:hypothetical protein